MSTCRCREPALWSLTCGLASMAESAMRNCGHSPPCWSRSQTSRRATQRAVCGRIAVCQLNWAARTHIVRVVVDAGMDLGARRGSCPGHQASATTTTHNPLGDEAAEPLMLRDSASGRHR